MPDTSTLEELYAKAVAIERAEASSMQMLADSKMTSTVNKVTKVKTQQPQESKQPTTTESDKPTCFQCGKMGHKSPECRMDKSKLKCTSCGHVATVCRQKKEEIHHIDGEGAPWTATIDVQGKPLKFELDTGCEYSIVPVSVFQTLRADLKKSDKLFQPYGTSATIPALGMSTVKIQLGREWLHKLGIYSPVNHVYQVKAGQQCMKDLESEFQDVFAEGIGCAHKSVSIKFKDNAKPVFMKHRSVPYALKDKIETELDRMVKDGSLMPVEHIDEASAAALTINTRKGLFRPTRLMFGCASAPVIWTKFIEEVISGIEGLGGYFDDLVVSANDVITLKSRLSEVLRRLQANGLRLNLQKCSFFLDSVTYLGHEISAAGIRPAKDGLQAIQELPPPANLPIVLSCDASPEGLGAVLAHQYPDGSERPILYIHRKLDKCQVKYSQIDKESLAIKWAVEKLNIYLVGRQFTLITNHAPLVHIFGIRRKKLPTLCATRLLHYAIFLQDFSFTIKYRKSEEHGNADFLSRLPQHSSDLRQAPTSDDPVDLVQLHHISLLPLTHQSIAQHTQRDIEGREWLQKLRSGETLGENEDGLYSLQ
ncbi:uncharacterized protein K02A2.6-like [Photinus pyralis]|uniref:uncharacterized protein K02A2.6-like n=1 Tax=Photinus pyralis TaxID=7054 RepID=UPI001266EA0B|nr:uncharacterized protein K02A2.6-like [Photinus pyralis]